MNPMPLYILRHNPSNISHALFSPNDSPDHVVTISRVLPGTPVSGGLGSLVLSGEGTSSEGGEGMSYDKMLEMVLAAKKIMVL